MVFLLVMFSPHLDRRHSTPHPYSCGMFTLAELEVLATSFPEVTVGSRHGRTTWFVNGNGFAWERPLSKADIKRWGDSPLPLGTIVALATDGLDEKEAILQSGTKGVFTISHFDGYPAVLVLLDAVPKRAMREMLLDAWLACAKPSTVDAFLAARRTKPGARP
jgi:hypothetical protein